MTKKAKPHRWLRKDYTTLTSAVDYSPPHRWLRKFNKEFHHQKDDSPPHRWLRKPSVFKKSSG
ncbi:hypothetical protein [uncultured Gammaproteobacteria bacterium]|nr:hypothetical protein [uncultured Gammaproteobacteria bacterium]